jgi:hypothetical protein
VFVDTTGIRATDFTIAPEVKLGLFDKGQVAAEHFLAAWDFDRWSARFGVPGAA